KSLQTIPRTVDKHTPDPLGLDPPTYSRASPPRRARRSRATNAFSERMKRRPSDRTGIVQVSVPFLKTSQRDISTYCAGSALASTSCPSSARSIRLPSATIKEPRPSPSLSHLTLPVSRSTQRKRRSLNPYKLPSYSTEVEM